MLIDYIIRRFLIQELERQTWWIDNTTLLNYGYQFIRNLHAMYSRSRAWTLSHCNSHDTKTQLTLFNKVSSQL